MPESFSVWLGQRVPSLGLWAVRQLMAWGVQLEGWVVVQAAAVHQLLSLLWEAATEPTQPPPHTLALELGPL